MTAKQLITLGLAGIKPSDIKEIGDCGFETEDIVGLVKQGYKMKDIKELAGLITETEPEDKTEPTKPAELESKKEDLDKIAALENQIKEMQQDNINKDHSGEPPVDPITQLQALYGEE